MKIHGAVLLPLLGMLLLFTSSIHGEEKKNHGLEIDRKSSEKISTSLILHDNNQKNHTDSLNPPEFSVITVTSSRTSSNDHLMSFRPGLRSFTINNTPENSTTISDRISPDEDDLEDDEIAEALPEAQELRHANLGNRRRPFYRPSRRPPTVNRRNVFPAEPVRASRRPTRKPVDGKREPTEKDCTFFGKTVCLKTLNYPQEAILRSIRSNKEMMTALLKDFNVQSENRNEESYSDDFLSENRFENRFETNEIKKRSDYSLPFDNIEEGFTCPSQVMYARPQLARAASGLWKYIINTGEHTQTLRLEKCSKPKASCSFISENYRSSCIQVYNYHRLLTWDNNLGLHMDIFKIPSCCSCHVHGYTELYPPISKDPPLPGEESFPGAEYASEQDDDSLHERPSSYLTKFKPSANFDNNFVSSGSKPIADAGTHNRPKFALPGRSRPKKPSSSSATRPFDKLPQQHAPNTRAPGYKGPVHKGTHRPIRPSRPFRRDSSPDLDDSSSNSPLNTWFSQTFDQDTDASTKLQTGDFDDDYQEPNRRINYNYHPIIDFFKPEASMLKSSDPSSQTASIEMTDDNDSWKPMITN